jgi:hypothetical protein
MKQGNRKDRPNYPIELSGKRLPRAVLMPTSNY